MSVFDTDQTASRSIYETALGNSVLESDLKPAWYAGAWKAPFTGLASAVNDGVLLAGDAVTPGLRMVARPVDKLFGTSSEQWLVDQQQIAVDNIKAWSPDPRTTGWLGMAVHGLVNVLPEAVAGGPETAAVLQGYKGMRRGMAEGLDPATAMGQGAIEGVSTYVGMRLPMTVGAGAPLWANAGFGVATNLATGAVSRGAIGGWLEARGYSDMATQYRIFDQEAMMVDAIMGAGFGAFGHFVEGRPAPNRRIGDIRPSDLDAALAASNHLHMEVDTLPGLPTDPAARNAHVEALNKALEDLLVGREVTVDEAVTQAKFDDKPESGLRRDFDAAIAEHMGPEWEAAQQALRERGLPDNLDLYARGSDGRGVSAEKITRAVRNAFQGEGRALEEGGRVKVVETPDHLPARADGTPHPADTKGMFDGERVYIVAKNVSANEVPGVLLHEVGAHYGMEAMLGSKLYRQLLSEVDAKAKAGDRDYAEAMKRVPADTPQEKAKDELLAYLVQHQPELPLVRRLLAQVKQFLYRVLGGRFVKLNADDIRMMAVAALKRVSSAEASRLSDSMYSQQYRGPIFYSPLERAIAGAKQDAMPADQWAAWIKSNAGKLGVKKAELDDVGLYDYLALRGKDKVTRDEITQFIQQNGVQVQEVTKGGNASEATARLNEALENTGYSAELNEDGDIVYFNTSGDEVNRWDLPPELDEKLDAVMSSILAAPTKHENWVLPGGENYRELLLTLPVKQTGELPPGYRLVDDAQVARAEGFDIPADQVGPWFFEGPGVYSRMYPTREEALTALRIDAKDKEGRLANFRSSHWDEPNILAHIRFNDRVDADGNKVLFIEELQSDWAQEGRKKGFGSDPLRKNEAGDYIFTRQDGVEINLGPNIDEVGFRANMGDAVGAVPAAPFVTDTKAWLSLGIKRMIAYAAENGYDKVAFVNGQQSAERYDLSKHVSKIYWNVDNKDLFVQKVGEDGMMTLATNVSEDELADHIGKEAAQKLVESEPRQTGRSKKSLNYVLEGVDLKVGREGKGMIKFYDEIVPQVANDVLKKLGGGKVEEVAFPAGKPSIEKAGSSYYQVPSKIKAMKQPGFTITPEMRSSVLEGQPLYARGGVEKPGVDVAQENLNGFEPDLRVKIPVGRLKLPEKPLVLTGTNMKNAARQIAGIDEALAKFPDADKSPLEWSKMMAYAMASDDVPIPPYRFLQEINSDGAVRKLETLTSGQIADADHGFENARLFREAYTSGRLDVETTGKLFLWSFLSRGVSPYTQEGLFIDAYPGIDKWVKKAAAGELTEADFGEYEAWAKSVAPQGSGQPGAGATHNLNAFGKLFLFKMGQRGEDGVSKLQKMHDMMADPNMTGQQIRRWFIANTEGVGIDNKVVSFTLLVAGFPDVMVLDRVQIRQLWDDGRFAERNLYDGRKVEGKSVAGSALADITYGARGLLIYEAVERALAKRIENIYSVLGRPQDASIGRYHWETWVADSQQEASHGTLDAILHDARGNPEMISEVTAKEGEYGAYQYGARYGRTAGGEPYFLYKVGDGAEFRFSVQGFRDFMDAIKSPKNGVVPAKFKVTEAGNAPWYERSEVNKARIEELAAEYAVQPEGGGAGAVQAAGAGEAVSNRTGRADPYSAEAVIANRPDLTVALEDGSEVPAGRALAQANEEIATAQHESQAFDVAAACAMRS